VVQRHAPARRVAGRPATIGEGRAGPKATDDVSESETVTTSHVMATRRGCDRRFIYV
jgi:hypothetical protein